MSLFTRSISEFYFSLTMMASCKSSLISVLSAIISTMLYDTLLLSLFLLPLLLFLFLFFFFLFLVLFLFHFFDLACISRRFQLCQGDLDNCMYKWTRGASELIKLADQPTHLTYPLHLSPSLTHLHLRYRFQQVTNNLPPPTTPDMKKIHWPSPFCLPQSVQIISPLASLPFLHLHLREFELTS